jgi:hypothetical protein
VIAVFTNGSAITGKAYSLITPFDYHVSWLLYPINRYIHPAMPLGVSRCADARRRNVAARPAPVSVAYLIVAVFGLVLRQEGQHRVYPDLGCQQLFSV